MGGKNGKNCAIRNCIISAGGAIKLHFFGTSAEESATILSCFCGENIKICRGYGDKKACNLFEF